MLLPITPAVPATSYAINDICEGLSNATLMQSDAEFETTYDLGDEVGRGGWAIVFTATVRQDPAPPSLAVKVMDKVKLGQRMDVRSLADRLRDECRVLTELQHPHVVRLIEICESPEHLFIVMERASGGALLERILERGCFLEPDARCVMHQLLDVLCFMHSHGVIHRDIKPENILLDDSTDAWNIKVSDFGLVKIFSDQDSLADSLPNSVMGSRIGSRLASLDPSAPIRARKSNLDACHTRNVGTPLYRAPEQVYNAPPYPSTYGPGVDVWCALSPMKPRVLL